MFEKNVNETLLKREPSASNLVKILESNYQSASNNDNMVLYHQFPFYSTDLGEFSIRANILLASNKHGLLIFECVDYSERAKIDFKKTKENLSEIDSLIFGKLMKDSAVLRKDRRNLKIEIRPCLFLLNCEEKPLEFSEFECITNEYDLFKFINSINSFISEEEFNDLKATIEGSKGISKPSSRKLKDQTNYNDSKGAILTLIENEICNFDTEQKRAALFTLDGAQRIRGLAGSGKTIILAMKAALIHLQNPEANILYTYYTKNLNDLVKRLITKFYRQFSEKDPNWDKIFIMHAWGGKSIRGVYYNTCVNNNIKPINLEEAKINNPSDPFEFACSELYKNNLSEQFDYALLDEAQDFPLHFYRICRKVTKNNRVVWAYDDFQNILNIKMQDEKETFGKDDQGNYFIDFSMKEDELQDLVLHVCYRNPKDILTTAFALGLGVYNKDSKTNKIKMVQRLESNDHWESIGFEIEKGNSKTNDLMLISRPDKNSPLLKNTYLKNDVISILSFKSYYDECIEVVKMVMNDLEKELNPEDISIICLDDLNTTKYFSVITDQLVKRNIQVFDLQKAPTNNTIYKVLNHISLSSVYKAKGNEAGSVYILGIDSVFADKNNITERNKLFTAITRSLGWVTLTGLSPLADICMNEFSTLKSKHFKLEFIQPSEADVKTIRQDINKKQAALNKIERLADELSRDLNMPKNEVVEEIKKKLIKTKK